MRGLRKPWPPGNVSPDEQQARTWKQAEEAFLEELPRATDRSAYARSAFDAMDKRKLRSVMLQEQGKLCVYCERRVDEEDHPIPRIEHWRPLSDAHELALHWRNLYLSCTTEMTCDCRKQDIPLRADVADPDLPWPVEHPYERCVGFTSLGEAYVRSDAPLDEAQRQALALALGMPHDDILKDNGILNLNHPALVAARVAALDSERSRLERDYKGKMAPRDDRMERAAALLCASPLREFISIRVRWLERSLGKAR